MIWPLGVSKWETSLVIKPCESDEQCVAASATVILAVDVYTCMTSWWNCNGAYLKEVE
jgi:hypothetical protein